MIGCFVSQFGRSLLVGLVFIIPRLACATTYTCTGVKEKALLGISSGSVGVSSHDQICEFSVDGVSPTGKQSPDFVSSMNQLLSGSFDGNSATKEGIVSLVLGPFLPERPDSYFMSRFDNVLGRSAVRDIGDCMAGFQQNPSSSSRARGDRDFTCRVLGPDDARRGDPTSFGPVQAQVTQPTLMVGLTIDRQSYVLFIPSQFIVLGMRGFRLGR